MSLFGQGIRARSAGFVVLLAIVVTVAAPAAASAATTFIVAPTATRTELPCTAEKPCELIWALKDSASGDTIQLQSGEYDLDGSAHDATLEVPAGVILAQAAHDTSRPLIKQTVPFATCSCATLTLGEKSILRDLAVEQPTQALKEGVGVGAVAIGPGATVERTVITGADNGVSFAPEAPIIGDLRDSLVTAGTGAAVEVLSGFANVDNVTAIAHGANGVALEARSLGAATKLEVTNTIARGEGADVTAEDSGGPASVSLHYSDARTARETSVGGASIEDSDHPMHAEPTFVSSTNYAEAAGSPTIDAGAADPRSGASDLVFQPRSAGPSPDIGAYEFQGLAPAASTGTVRALSGSTAVISGTLDSEDGANTQWSFNYGLTKSYGLSTPAQSIASMLSAQSVSATLSGLTPGKLYHFQLVASNERGTVAGADVTFTTTLFVPPRAVFFGRPNPTRFAIVAPIDSALRLSRIRFRAAARGATISAARAPIGASILYSDSQAATTTFVVLERQPGVRSGHACIARPSHPRPGHRYLLCTRYLRRGSFAHHDRAGLNRLSFSGRLYSHKLPAGVYRLTATPRTAAGTLGTTVGAGFTILA